MNNLHRLSSPSNSPLQRLPFLHTLTMTLQPTSWRMHQIQLCGISGNQLHSSQWDSPLLKQDIVLLIESCLPSIWQLNIFSILLKDGNFISVQIINPHFCPEVDSQPQSQAAEALRLYFPIHQWHSLCREHWELCCRCTVKNWDQCHSHRSVPYYCLCCHNCRATCRSRTDSVG